MGLGPAKEHRWERTGLGKDGRMKEDWNERRNEGQRKWKYGDGVRERWRTERGHG